MKHRSLSWISLIFLFIFGMQLCKPGSKEVSAQPFRNLVNGELFVEDFSDNSAGWALGNEWQFGPATESSADTFGNPDPANDHTPTTEDNGVAGVVIGGNALDSLHGYYYLTSPVINTSSVTGPLTLEFYRWLNSDTDPYMNNSIEVYNGSSWVEIWQSAGSPGIEDFSWVKITHDITAYKNANLRVRFGHMVSANGAYIVSSWNVDDVRILKTNSVPVAQNEPLITAEDTEASFTTIAADVDGGTLSYTIVTPPTHGALSGTAPNLTYTPHENYYGDDILTFKVNDGLADSNVATITIFVIAENDAPEAAVIADEGWLARTAGVYVIPAFTDVEGDTLSYTAKLANGANLPVWLHFDAATGRFSGMPVNADAGSYVIAVTADDGQGGITISAFTLIVTANPYYIFLPMLLR